MFFLILAVPVDGLEWRGASPYAGKMSTTHCAKCSVGKARGEYELCNRNLAAFSLKHYTSGATKLGVLTPDTQLEVDENLNKITWWEKG